MNYHKPTVVDYGSIAEHTFDLVDKGTGGGKDLSADVSIIVDVDANL